jgi:hypothetical protein
LTFIGLHGVISQGIELFIATAVRTSNPKLISQQGTSEIPLINNTNIAASKIFG